MANGRLRECRMCKNLIAYRVAYRLTSEPKPETIPDATGIFGKLGARYSDVCKDHIDHFKIPWEEMEGGMYVVDVYPQKPPPELPRGQHIEPTTYSFDDSLRFFWSEEGWFFLETTTYAPESAIGRKATLRVRPNQIVPLINALKEVAIVMRSKPMSDTKGEE